MKSITCPQCGEQFEPNHPSRRYCSSYCKQRTKDLKRSAAQGAFCDICGEVVLIFKHRSGDTAPRHKSCQTPYDELPPHGTAARYDLKSVACRCDACRVAKNELMREYLKGYRARHRETHGEPYNVTRARKYFENHGVLYSGEWISETDRIAIYERDSWICGICLEPLDRECHWNEAGAPTIDHIIPRSLGGHHGPENLRAAHRGCNARRGAFDERLEILERAGVL